MVNKLTLNENDDMKAGEESANSFNYQMLSRLKSDCDYFLGYGGRSPRCLWAHDVKAQIAKMRELYNIVPEKPEWLSSEDIDKYEKEMTSSGGSYEMDQRDAENRAKNVTLSRMASERDNGSLGDRITAAELRDDIDESFEDEHGCAVKKKKPLKKKAVKESTIDDDEDEEDPEIAELQAKIQAVRDRRAKEKAEREAEEQRKATLAAKLDSDPLVKEVLDIIDSDEETDDKIQKVFDKLVPGTGNADSTAGELIRAIMKIMYRAYNDGDVFYEGYGIETCGNAVAYICDKIEDLYGDFKSIAEDGETDETYDSSISKIGRYILGTIKNNPEWIIDNANEDMYDSDASWVEENAPTYDDSYEIPPRVQDHIDAGNVDIEDLQDWDEFRNCDIAHGYGSDVEISGMSREQYDNVTDNWIRWMNSWADDLDNEFGVPGEAVDDEDGDGDDVDESKKGCNKSKAIKESEENIYQERGFKNRKEYLANLADECGISLDTVISLASVLGPEEDFDGLVSAAEDAMWDRINSSDDDDDEDDEDLDESLRCDKLTLDEGTERPSHVKSRRLGESNSYVTFLQNSDLQLKTDKAKDEAAAEVDAAKKDAVDCKEFSKVKVKGKADANLNKLKDMKLDDKSTSGEQKVNSGKIDEIDPKKLKKAVKKESVELSEDLDEPNYDDYPADFLYSYNDR